MDLTPDDLRTVGKVFARDFANLGELTERQQAIAAAAWLTLHPSAFPMWESDFLNFLESLFEKGVAASVHLLLLNLGLIVVHDEQVYLVVPQRLQAAVELALYQLCAELVLGVAFSFAGQPSPVGDWRICVQSQAYLRRRAFRDCGFGGGMLF